MKKIFLNGTMCMLAFGLMLGACKKDEERPNANVTETAVEDNSTSLAESDDVLAIAESVLMANTANMRLSAEEETTSNYCGATITIDQTAKKITIDFGTGKTCDDGRTRKGKIYIDYTGRYRVAGSTQIITFDNYYVNNHKIEGKKTLTHASTNGAAIANVTNIVVENFKVSFSDGIKLEWSSTRTRTWDNKGTLSNFSDDEFTLSGTLTGKSKDSKNYTAVIDDTKPLLWKVSCLSESQYVAVSGIIKITPEAGLERMVDYGNGACDRLITISVGGISKEMTLKK
jgi:hypothetical protein